MMKLTQNWMNGRRDNYNQNNNQNKSRGNNNQATTSKIV